MRNIHPLFLLHNFFFSIKVLYYNFPPKKFTLKEHYDKTKEMDHLSDYQGRFYGRISEMIFNVWLEKMMEDGKIQKDQIKEIPVVTMEKINWFKKG